MRAARSIALHNAMPASGVKRRSQFTLTAVSRQSRRRRKGSRKLQTRRFEEIEADIGESRVSGATQRERKLGGRHIQSGPKLVGASDTATTVLASGRSTRLWGYSSALYRPINETCLVLVSLATRAQSDKIIRLLFIIASASLRRIKSATLHFFHYNSPGPAIYRAC